jgi:hypothetical protein
MTTPNGYFCFVCSAPLTGKERKWCGSLDCMKVKARIKRDRRKMGITRKNLPLHGKTFKLAVDNEAVDKAGLNPYHLYDVEAVRAFVRDGSARADWFVPWKEPVKQVEARQ